MKKSEEVELKRMQLEAEREERRREQERKHEERMMMAGALQQLRGMPYGPMQPSFPPAYPTYPYCSPPAFPGSSSPPAFPPSSSPPYNYSDSDNEAS